jgi:hypothetical protein
MNPGQRGQIVVLVAIFLSVAMMLLAVMVDAGRLFVERGRMMRAVQSAADAGIGVVAEEMVTLAEARRDAGSEACSPAPSCYLEAGDWDRLEGEPEVKAQVQAEARAYAARNALDPEGPQVTHFEVDYPLLDRDAHTLGVRVSARRRVPVLLIGLLGESFVDLEAEGLSVIHGRP